MQIYLNTTVAQALRFVNNDDGWGHLIENERSHCKEQTGNVQEWWKHLTFRVIAVRCCHSSRRCRERHLFRTEGDRFDRPRSCLRRGSEPSLDKARTWRRPSGQTRCGGDRRLHRPDRGPEPELGRRRKSGSEVKIRFLFAGSAFALPNFADFRRWRLWLKNIQWVKCYGFNSWTCPPTK